MDIKLLSNFIYLGIELNFKIKKKVNTIKQTIYYNIKNITAYMLM